jgi:pyruvate/2-oxoglutarate dehydrogenase complex dihydrolipoamide acyltransferase (E2) component
MNRLQPVRFSVAAMALAMVALAVGVFYFLAGMSQTTYLVTDGIRVGVQYVDKPRYDMHLQGLIFTISFLIAGALLLLMVLLPDREHRAERAEEAPPQPRRQPAQPQGAQAAPQAAAQHAPPAVPPRAAQAAAAQTSPLSIEGGEGEPGREAVAVAEEPALAAAAPQPTRPSVSVEEEVLRSATREDDLPAVDFGENRYDETGEEDVVYGAGRVTEDAVWDFVQQYPDSAVKFLYRKTLDNKPLSPTEEDIYRNWEMRGMTRAKVREIVLEIMRWQSLPDSFPHEIWRALRDQIYEFRAAAR